jgi:uncharacterized membrane protein
MTMETEQRLIDDYLERLERAAHRLAPEQRAELLAEIREHIESARTADEITSEAGLRELLDRLGEPEEIVAASAGPTPTEPTSTGRPAGMPTGQLAGPPIVPPRRSLALEIWAVVMLTVGSLIPILGWLVGVVLLWLSPRWQVREKLLGTLVVPGGIGILIHLSAFLTRSCTTSYNSDGSVLEDTCGDHPVADVVGPIVAIVVTILALVVPLVLLHLARRRRDAEVGDGVKWPQP